MQNIEKKINQLIEKSIRAWERSNNNLGDPELNRINLEKQEKIERGAAEEIESTLKEINPSVKIDWPGLYPTFELDGRHFYDVQSLLNYLSEVKLWKK